MPSRKRMNPWKPALAAALSVLALAASPAAAQPRAEPVEPVVDVGKSAKGETIAHTFEIRNAGDETLEITQVKPACGCTVAKYDRTIAPGKSGKIHAEVETDSFRGPIAKSISVFTNDTGNPQINLVVKADVEPHVDVRPGYARFIAVEGESMAGSSQALWSDSKPDLAVRKVTSPFPYLVVSHREATREEAESPGREWRIEMTLKANAPVGPLADYVLVETDHPREKVVQIPVSGIVRPVLSVVPRVADFGRRKLDEPQLTTLEIKNLGAGKVDLTGIESDLRWVEAELESVEEGRHYKLVLTLKPGMKPGDFAGVLKIRTSSPRQPLLEVSMKGTVL